MSDRKRMKILLKRPNTGPAGRRLLLALALSAASFAANAQICTVASVHDGDTLRVRCPGSAKTIPVRLERIDAPELGQAGGMAARDFLRLLCPLGRQTRLTQTGKDRYGRTLGDVDCGSGSAQQAMLRNGHAWVYPTFSGERALVQLQGHAQRNRLGLWKSAAPVAPWTFRKKQRG